MKISESQRHTLSQGGMRDVLTILFKHQGKIITVFLGTFLTVSIGTFLMPSIYEAESTIMVKMGREHMYRSEVGAGGPTMSYDQERVMDSEIQILSSRDLVQKVLENLGVEKTYPEIYENLPKDMTPLDVAIEKLQKDISFSKIGEANVLKIKFEHQTPEVAAKVVNKITELLMNKHLQIYSNPQTSFLDSQLVIYREQLEESRSQLQDFKKRHKLSSFAEERNLILQERSNLQATLKSIQNKKEGLRSKLASLRRQIAEIPEHIPLVSVTERQGVIDGLKSNFLELQLKEQQLLTKYKETSRFVTDVRRDLGLVKEFLKAQEDNQTDRVTTGKNPVYQDLHIQVLRTESELTSLGPEATEMTQQATELDEKLFKLDQLERDLGTLKLCDFYDL